MKLTLNEDQQMLQAAARDFCSEKAPVSVLRRLRDDKDPLGYDKNIWQQMIDLGWTGMAIPEAYGGYEFGYGGLGVILEETGRTLVASPLMSTVVLGGSIIALGGSETQKSTLLPAIVSGELTLALALEESSFHDPAKTACEAISTSEGYALSGTKTFVLDGHIADKLIVVARTAGQPGEVEGLSLFIVDKDADGLEIQRRVMVDSRNAAAISLNRVQVNQDALLGELNGGFELLDRVLDIGRIALSAEMLGSIQQVFEATVDYLKERIQFGVPIGAFQALQHRAADMYSEIELCRSLVRGALNALDEKEDPQRIAQLASAAKAKVSETFFNVSNEGVQMHGGIGMTDEFDIGFYLKRARVAQQTFGDAAFHRDRFATLQDF